MFNQKPLAGNLIDYGNSLSQGLVGLWLLNEGSGNKVFDLSGNGHDGTIEGDVSWIAGKFGAGLNFEDTIDNSIEFSSMPTLSARSYSYWINPRSGGGVYSMIVMETGTWTAIVDSAGQPRIRAWTVEIYTLPAYGQWYHIIQTYNGTYRSIYVDGILKHGPTSVVIGSDYITRIGVDHPTDPYSFYGLVDNMMVWNRALSDSEISQLYQEPFCMVRTRRRRIIYDGVEAAPTTFPYYYREIASRRIA